VAALADVLRAAGSGVIEIATDVDHRDVAPEYPKSVGEVDWLAELSEVVGRPVTFGMAQSRAMPGLDDAILAAVHRARGRGVDLRPQTTARGVGVLYSLRSRTPWDRATEWQELRPLGVEQRLDRLRDAVARERLVDGAETSLDLAEVYIMPSGDARYDQGSAQSIAVVARRAGTTPADVFIDLSLETDGRALLNWPFLNHDLDAVAGMLDDPAVLLGLGDAGAHVGMIMDASQPTFLLTYWVRERRRFGIAEAVRRLTSDAAELFGIVDRGVLRPGAFADVNVVHFEGLRLPVPEYVQDFPQGAGRFVQRALGYDMTLVNGKVAVAHGEPTAAKAGRVLRSR
jgi:N-acyl-D-aspartate/D-glutamate deacylase